MATAFGWENSKENIQPLKGGRDPSRFTRAFGDTVQNNGEAEEDDAHDDAQAQREEEESNYEQQILEEKGEFERLIASSNNSADPLTAWEKYITWAKQAFVTGNSEVLPVLERCTRTFQDDARYKEDLRYLRIWITYADQCHDPEIIFRFLDSKQIGQDKALFYEAWAIVLENKRRYSAAEKVYQRGLNRGADPLRRLKRHFDEFSARVVQRIEAGETGVEEDTTTGTRLIDEDGENRNALGSLQMSKKGNVSAARQTSRRPRDSGRRGASTVSSSRSNGGRGDGNKGNNARTGNAGGGGGGGFAIFDESSGRGAESEAAPSAWNTLPVESVATKENVRAPSAWNSEQLPQRRTATRRGAATEYPIAADLADTFQIHEDDGIAPSSASSHCGTASSLLGRHETSAPDLRSNPLQNFGASSASAGSRTAPPPSSSSSSSSSTRRAGSSSKGEKKAKVRLPEAKAFHESLLVDADGGEMCFEEARALLDLYIYIEEVEMSMEEDSDDADMDMDFDESCDVSCDESCNDSDGDSEVIEQDKENDDLMSWPSSSSRGQPSMLSMMHHDGGNDDDGFEGGPSLSLLNTPTTPSGFLFDCDGGLLTPSTCQTSDSLLANTPVSAQFGLTAIMSNLITPAANDNSNPSNTLSNNTPSSVSGQFGRSCSTPTMTIHTKEAMAEVMGMFNDTLSFPASSVAAASTSTTTAPPKKYRSSNSYHEADDEEDDDEDDEGVDENMAPQGHNFGHRSTSSSTSTSSLSSSFPPLTSSTSSSIDPLSTRAQAASQTGEDAFFIYEEGGADDTENYENATGAKAAQQPALDDKKFHFAIYEDPTADEDHNDVASISAPGGIVSPFSQDERLRTLDAVSQKLTSDPGYYSLADSGVPAPNTDAFNSSSAEGVLQLACGAYNIQRKIGEGGYASVFLAEDLDAESDESGCVALKVHPPTNVKAFSAGDLDCAAWEYYIAKELQRRVPQEMSRKFTMASQFERYSDVTFMTMEYNDRGTLQDVINLYKKRGKNIDEPLVVFYAIELLRIVETMHNDANMVHCDIKPDNLLVLNDEVEGWEHWQPGLGGQWNRKGLQLIDFGLTVDRSLYDASTSFAGNSHSDASQCVAMRSSEEWTTQPDLFGICGVVHCLLHGEYMEIEKKQLDENEGECWMPKKAFKRYWQVGLWKSFFAQLLNAGGNDPMPDLGEMRRTLEGYLVSVPTKAKAVKILLCKQTVWMFEESNL
eukprot:TRINITY_DN512_c5_g1_i1.p1 TRINITY_DN512_c5_g1~~TRINITY_DN512_c5_g1_i1.p1  ORF type:complete len:1292 (-),score=394.95 TRINITY_DN512_c5_g1_i1:109-3783(-)